MANFLRREEDDMTYWMVDGRKLTLEEYEELQRQKKLEKQRVLDEEQRLTKHLAEGTFAGEPGKRPADYG
jgi:hypothetical protein